MQIIYLIIGLIIGGIIIWFYVKSKPTTSAISDAEINGLKTNLAVETAKTNSITEQLKSKESLLEENSKKINELSSELSSKKTALESFQQQFEELKVSNQKSIDENQNYQRNISQLNAENRVLQEKLDNQKKEIEDICQQFQNEFKVIANQIFEDKSQKFTELNKTNLKDILEPLGKNIDEFKKTVNETYDKEAKERFSLGEKVKELAQLNQQISEEARNLTKALKGEAKTQGRWGEMILESILEKSGLTKDREYFMEEELRDDDNNPLYSDSENKKMRPDALIKYPDNRCVIIDSKVSLNAFSRYIATDDPDEQKKELNDHIAAIKNHIISLSTKGYDDYKKSLDFVMMFIPSEPAYMAALQGDADLWNFAYDKRILLISPTNLITSLKLIVDLWKREYQNQNAQDIAERGAKLYDKFVGFVATLEDLGKYIYRAREKYHEAHKHLTSGNDNLIRQAQKLQSLGIKNKKSLPGNLLTDSDNNSPEEDQ